MNVRELIHGYYYFNKYGNQEIQWDSIRLPRPLKEELDSIEGVPLTAEWLEKFGFQKCTDGDYLKDDAILINKDMAQCTVLSSDPYCGYYLPHDILYVHKLQNLYFALTGQELEIKK